MTMHWTPELAVGVEEIDAQHRALIDRVNRLFEGCAAGSCPAEIGTLLNFLGEYVESHFTAEETLMEECAFPHREEHRREHHAFRARMTMLAGELTVSGPTTELQRTVQEAIIDWLFDHICIRDRALGKYLGAAR